MSCAQLAGVSGEMVSYVKETSLSYLMLKEKEVNWITLTKDIYCPGEHIEGR